jgi:hypothetical protein
LQEQNREVGELCQLGIGERRLLTRRDEGEKQVPHFVRDDKRLVLVARATWRAGINPPLQRRIGAIVASC